MRILKSLRVGLLLLCCASTQAQDADSVVMVDSVTTSIAADSTFHFDTITADIAPLERHIIPDSTVQRLRRDDAFWYANTIFKKKKEVSHTDLSLLQRLFAQAWLRNLLWFIIIASFVVVLFLFLLKSNITLFHKKPVVLSATGDTISAKTIFSLDYERAINTAKAAGDLRLAVRLYYLQILALLAGKNLIRYKEDFTNSDYLAQLRQSPYYEEFKKLTRRYEYTWYGQFPVAQAAFQNMEADFSTFKNNMGI